MTNEQMTIILEGIALGEICGLTDLVEYFDNQQHSLMHAIPYEDLPSTEREITEAWLELYREIFAPHVDGYTEKLSDDMIQWMNQRSQNRVGEIRAVRSLASKCKDRKEYTPEIVELQKYGY